jgi:hypothetical protein
VLATQAFDIRIVEREEGWGKPYVKGEDSAILLDLFSPRRPSSADLKAVSQNLMHANLQVTDGVYGILSASDTRERIRALSRKGDRV